MTKNLYGKRLKIDLHVHTNMSDGTLSIDEVLEKASDNKVTHIAVTDHDTIKGIKKAVEVGKSLGVRVIHGIEISAYSFKLRKKVHVLGYNFNINAFNICRVCYPLVKKRNQNSLRQIDILSSNGFSISIEEVKYLARKGTAVYKQHIMDLLMRKGYTSSIYSCLYNELFKGEGICAGDIDYIDVFDAIEAVKRDGGIAVIAHPGYSGCLDVIETFIEAGLDGIEINHPKHSDEDRNKIINLAAKHSLVLTGGSDFHGGYGDEEVDIGQYDTPTPERFLSLID
jgi:phosphoribosyl 1,2-cyclic phosphate 1,2-diphosphodiesterase